MKQEEIKNWEVPEIDLNLRHYSGSPSDIIKTIKLNLEVYLSNPEVPFEKRKIYSAIYNALNYYRDISYLPSPDHGIGDSFLSSSIRKFNEDYEYLSQKYNDNSSNENPIITFKSRIKAPISFMDKVKEKISEYLEQGRDLSYFNESLRDLIGVRCIINPPQEIQSQGLQAESDFLYKVFYDLMSHRGIDKDLDKRTYKFIPVNTRHDPQKAKKIKERPNSEGFFEDISSGKLSIFIPETRLPEIEQDAVDSVLKDYNKYPKYKGYQSLHICITPDFSDTIEHSKVPNYIIPPACSDYSFEYQFRTQKQDDFSEHGPASHNSTYKPTESYHRLAVPFFITSDSIADMQYSAKKSSHNKHKLRLRNFGESFKQFYGVSFESYFGIPYKRFIDSFSPQNRNDILAGKKLICYDKEHDLYTLKNATSTLSISPQEMQQLKSILAEDNIQELSSFLENHYLKDSIIKNKNKNDNIDSQSDDYTLSTSSTTNSSSKIKLYTFETSADRAIKNELLQENSSNLDSNTSIAVRIGRDLGEH